MRKRFLQSLVTNGVLLLVLCFVALAQDSAGPLPGLPQQPNIVEVMKWLDQNGLVQARVGIRTSPQAREEISGVVQQEAYPALSLIYSEGFKFIQIENCGVILRNDNTKLISHSKLAHDPAPGERIAAELFIPLNRFDSKKGRKPFRRTSDPDKAQLLGTWQTEFKTNHSREDVVLTLFAPGKSDKLGVWKAEALTFTFDSKDTSEKFDTAFRQAIKICQPIEYLKR
jgi:hypothetical protein